MNNPSTTANATIASIVLVFITKSRISILMVIFLFIVIMAVLPFHLRYLTIPGLMGVHTDVMACTHDSYLAAKLALSFLISSLVSNLYVVSTFSE